MDLTTGQVEVLKGFKRLGAVDDSALSAYVHHMADTPMASSGVRTRRAELVAKGAVAVTGTHRLKSGRSAAIHSITPAGRKALSAALRATKRAKVTA